MPHKEKKQQSIHKMMTLDLDLVSGPKHHYH